MKTMTCHQLGGACEKKFEAETFAEIAEMSKKHGSKQADQGDDAHLEAMAEMTEMMNDPDAMSQWMTKKEQEFNALPNQLNKFLSRLF